MITQGKGFRKFRFTMKTLEALPPHDRNSPSTNCEYSDDDCIGLRVLVSKNGRKFFDFRYVYNKRKRVVRIGEFPAVTVAEARARVNEHKNMLSKGVDPLGEKNKDSSVPLLADFAEKDYLPWAKQHKKSWRFDQLKLEADIIPALGKLTLSAITMRDIQQFIAKIKERTSGPTANRFYALLSKLFNLAVEWQIIEKSPCKGLKKFKESSGRERFLSKDEIQRFFVALDQHGETTSVCVVKFLLFTGVRLSEALQTRWDDVDMENGTLLISMNRSKSGKSRRVTLNSLAMIILEKMQHFRTQSNPYVFPGKKPGEHHGSPKRLFESARKLSKISGLRLHDLRHTYASLAVEGGATLYEVQKLLGHGSSQMTQRYAHLSDASLKKVAENVADQISRAAA